jgi:hypothetical protein
MLHHPLLQEINLKYSRFAYEQMFYQFMQSHAMNVVDRSAPKGLSADFRLA